MLYFFPHTKDGLIDYILFFSALTFYPSDLCDAFWFPLKEAVIQRSYGAVCHITKGRGGEGVLVFRHTNHKKSDE